MSIIRDALQYLVNLGQVKTIEVGEQIYSPSPLHLIREPLAKPLQVNTLSGVVEYLTSGYDAPSIVGALVHVVSPTEVVVVSPILDDAQREKYIEAEAFESTFRFGQWYDVESFIISLQSNFTPRYDRDRILKVVGNLRTEEGVKQYSDDGVTQAVTAKTGVAMVDEVAVPNPVTLAPYRTFIEVEQPDSVFVFRMKQDGGRGPQCALFEADGGGWKLEAMANIKAFFEARLAEAGITIIS